MTSGLDLLLVLGLTLVALVIFRVLVVLLVPERRLRSDRSVEEPLRSHVWRGGALVILLIGLGDIFVSVLLSGADLVSPLIPSVQLGVIYALMGIGLTLTYAVVKLPNFAHGDMVTLGAYAMSTTYAFLHFPVFLAFIVAAFAGAMLGLLQHLLVFRPLINRGAKTVQIMIASFALSIAIRQIFWMVASWYSVINFQPISATAVPIFGYIISKGAESITDVFLASVPTVAVLIILLHLLLTRTILGKSMRAVADNIELAQVTGINVERIRQVSWLLSGALAGISGAFFATLATIDPEFGWNQLLKVFAAITLGGLVSFYGTIAGGLIVGLGEQWVITVATVQYGLSSSWGPFMAFLLIVIVLLVRPEGLSGLSPRDLASRLLADFDSLLNWASEIIGRIGGKAK